MATWIWVNIGSGNGLLPDTKPLPEEMLTYRELTEQLYGIGTLSCWKKYVYHMDEMVGCWHSNIREERHAKFTQYMHKKVAAGLREFNSLRPSDAIWRQGTGSILAQVRACCPQWVISWPEDPTLCYSVYFVPEYKVHACSILCVCIIVLRICLAVLLGWWDFTS